MGAKIAPIEVLRMQASLLSFEGAQCKSGWDLSGRLLSILAALACAGSFPALASSVPNSPIPSVVESALPQVATAASDSTSPASVLLRPGGTMRITATVTESVRTEAAESVLPQADAAPGDSISPASEKVRAAGTMRITATVMESTHTAVDLKLETSSGTARIKGN